MLIENGHGGNIHKLRRSRQPDAPIYDFSANINPLGPPPWLRSVISRELENVVHYPEPDCFELTSAIAAYHNLAQETVIAANGTTELLYLLPLAAAVKRAIIPAPCYIDYRKAMEQYGIEVVTIPLSPDDGFRVDCKLLESLLRQGDALILGSPNNPTGAVVDDAALLDLACKRPDVLFIIDEAFLDFIPESKSVSGKGENVVTLHSMTKFYAVPGLRLGYGVFPVTLAQKVRRILPPWSVNSLAQAVGRRLVADRDYQEKTRAYVQRCRSRLYSELVTLPGLTVFASQVNYHLLRLEGNMDSYALQQRLIKHNISIRICDNYDALDASYFRIAVRTEEENDFLLHKLQEALDNTTSRSAKRQRYRKTPALMVQGTSSNAGKSVLVAALCRILLQDGLRVAPFKAQNMSLNSFVTYDGREMGRAQVVQAQAARLDPDVRMNPVLLKPNSDVGSQVIVQGRPVGNMNVGQYIRYKAEAGRLARESYDSLAAEHEVMIIEGAGSPAEVNLKHHDIVNMEMARYAAAPVLLVGDIDRGGVYASFVGTMEVLEEWERQLVAGFLVNRFRGDATLLEDAHRFVFNHTGKEVLGVIPYLSELGLPEEDSVSFKDGALQKARPLGEHVEIALINLPHVSNFTDIEPLLEEPDVYLNIVSSPAELGHPDALVIPGSKNVFSDLAFLSSSGLFEAIRKLAEKETEIIGICGGYQILGKVVRDPHSIESDNGEVEGLGILDIETIMAPEKTLTRKEGVDLPSGKRICGYEIHHGLSCSKGTERFHYDDGSSCGAGNPQGNVWGAYLHGMFDADDFRRALVDRLRERKGLAAIGKVIAPYNLEGAFDRLADTVRAGLDMEKIYRLLKL